MPGVVGLGNGLGNAKCTLEFLNQTRPSLIQVGTWAVFEGTELPTKMARGTFPPATELEILAEEKALIDAIELAHVRYYGVHPTTNVRTAGRLSQDRQKMIAAIDDGVPEFGQRAPCEAFTRTTPWH